MTSHDYPQGYNDGEIDGSKHVIREIHSAIEHLNPPDTGMSVAELIEWALARQGREERTILGVLVALKDGPRDEDYERRKPAAWDLARALSHGADVHLFDLDCGHLSVHRDFCCQCADDELIETREALIGPTPEYAAVADLDRAERHRQIAKGWTPEHDDHHLTDELVALAGGRIEAGGHTIKALVEARAMLGAAIESQIRRGAEVTP